MAGSSGGDATRRRSGRARQAPSIGGDNFADPDEVVRRVRQASIERNRARRDEQLERARGEVIRARTLRMLGTGAMKE